jgi:hypothetical protein
MTAARSVHGWKWKTQQAWRPTRVGRFGNMHMNYSRSNESTQRVEGAMPRAVRVLRTIRVGLSTAAKASTLQTDSSMTKSKETSFQIAELFIDHPILAMSVLGLIALIGSVCIFAAPSGWLPF